MNSAFQQKYLEIAPEVSKALAKGQPVVALESTIISHGMPYPQNVLTAREVETIVRSEGAIPATIAILKGKLKVGLNEQELELLGKSQDVLKVSIRDIPYVIVKKAHGATTVAATMRIAELAGISVFVTGGLGGVHRGAEKTFDISADLTELSLTNVAVISAGVKSILDIGLTLEKLETLGVPVVGFQTSEFPAFYSRQSGFKVPLRCETPNEIAALMQAKWDLGIKGGIAIANPVPENEELKSEIINLAIDQALQEAHSQMITGKAVTPYLLAKIVELTGGESLKTNIALVKHNAMLGSQIAVAYANL